MRIVIFVVLGLLVADRRRRDLLSDVDGGGYGREAGFPISGSARRRAASGTGRLTKVSYGAQSIGDLSVKTDLFALFGGKAAGTLGLVREGLSGQAGIAYGLGGDGLDLKDLKIAGDTASVPGMPASIMRADGKFTLEYQGREIRGRACASRLRARSGPTR